MKNNNKNKIAIIGISVNLPGADNLESFWGNLINSKEAKRKLSKRRKEDILDYLKCSGKQIVSETLDTVKNINDIDEFDYKFFNFSPIEAKLTDPRQRKFLETVWSAIEDSGYMGDKIIGSDTGVYVGQGYDYETYGSIINEVNPGVIKTVSPSNMSPVIASRISYLLDLKGPNMMIDTACSSSLVALFQACQDLKNKRCDMAIAGGVRFAIYPMNLGVFSEIDSSDYKIKAFDNSANGTTWGEGVIALVLKSLDKAKKDKDNIYAIIKGGAINQDGHSDNITSPSWEAQTELLKKAWQDACIDPQTLSHIEAHGTGTKVGDPIEVKGISKAFESFTDKKQFCSLGSVKSNIGHLACASGLASVAKMVLSLQNKKIPPLINFDFPNKAIDFINSPVFINNKLLDWQSDKSPRRCGISAFGFSGTNCHIVLEEAPKIRESKKREEKDIFTISAKTKKSFDNLVLKYLGFLGKNKDINLNNLCYTANTGREQYNYRLAIITDDVQDLKKKLEKIGGKIENKDIKLGNVKKNNNSIKEIVLKEKEKENFYKIADLFIKGVKINWTYFYKNNFRKISLPTYPFEKIRCWVDLEKNAFSKNLHQDKLDYPLIDFLLSESRNQEIYQTYLDSGKDWFLKEHKVGDNIMLVGTAYMEMVIEIFEHKVGLDKVILKDSTHLAPMVFRQNEIKKVHIILNKKDDYFKISINSKKSFSDNWIKHFSCKVFLKENDDKRFFDLNKTFKDYKSFVYESENKNDDHEALKYGMRWDSVDKIYIKRKNTLVQGQALIKINIKDEFKDEVSKFCFHPALFDRFSVQSIIRKMTGYSFLYLPSFFGELKLRKKLSNCFYSYLYNFREDKEKGLFIFDNIVFDLNGEIISDNKNFEFKKVEKLNLQNKNEDNQLFYKIKWTPDENIEELNRKSDETVLIFKNNTSKNQQIINGLNFQRKIEVELGPNFKKNNRNSYIIKNTQEDYDRLIKDLEKTKIDRIIHLLTLNNKKEIKKIKDLNESQEKGAFSLFRLIKALQKNNKNKNLIRIILVSQYVSEITGEEERINPENSTFLSLGKAVFLEEKNLRCLGVDIDEKTKIKNIINLIRSNSNDFRVAYRNNKRYREILDMEDISKYQFREPKFLDGGAYIITGGLGGLGLEMADFISSLNNKINLVLIGRSKLPFKKKWNKIINDNLDHRLVAKLKRIKKIEKKGVNIFLLNGDVSSQKELEKILNKIRLKIGDIKGVIHCAGIAGKGFIIKKSESDFKRVYEAKVYGTWLLNNLTKKDKIDFFVNFSSIISNLGFLGQSDYASANAYLESFADYRNKKGKFSTTINWGSWKEVGMVSDNKIDNLIYSFKIISSLSTDEALDSFKKIFHRNIKNIIVNKFIKGGNKTKKFDFPIIFSEKLKRFLEAGQKQSSLNRKDKKIKLEGRREGYSSIEEDIAEAWNEVLGYEKFNVNDNFFELGGDSLSGIRFLTILNNKFNSNLLINDLFKAATIKSLALKIEKENFKASVSNKKVEKERNLSGGFPWTPIGDYLDDNKITELKNDFLSFDVDVSDFKILFYSLRKIVELYADIKIGFLLKNEKGYLKKYISDILNFSNNLLLDFSAKKISEIDKNGDKFSQILINNTEGREIFFLVVKTSKFFRFFISRDREFIKDKEFEEILIKLQKIYNLKMAGLEIGDLNSIDNTYAPFRSYPPYYQCVHSHLLEKIRWDKGIRISRNIFPAMDFSCLPNYFICHGKNRRKVNILNSQILKYNRFKIIGLDYKKECYNSWGKALAKYQKRVKKEEVMLLRGITYHIPGNQSYHDKEVFNYIRDERIIDGSDFALLQGDYNNNLVIHSIISNYYGQISQNDFFGFWVNSSVPNSVDKFGKINKDKSFFLYNISGLEKIKNTTPEQLKEALKNNVKEFFNEKTVRGGDKQNFKIAYFGKKALEIFKKELLDNLKNKKGSIPDIVVLDMLNRFVITYLLLHDILLELLVSRNDFYKDVMELANIVKKIDRLLNILSREIKKNKIAYNFHSHLFPYNDLYEINFLKKENKIKTLDLVNYIIEKQEIIFTSLAEKLKIR